jgi:hypothetical protein
MLALSEILEAQEDWVNFALWRARSIAYSSRTCMADAFDEEFLKQRIALIEQGAANVEALQILFVIGRELDGVDHFWDTNKKLAPDWQRCVDVYLAVTRRARVAALQTVFAMKTFVVGCRPMGRDVATLLAKLVYESREEAIAWYPQKVDFVKPQKGRNEWAHRSTWLLHLVSKIFYRIGFFKNLNWFPKKLQRYFISFQNFSNSIELDFSKTSTGFQKKRFNATSSRFKHFSPLYNLDWLTINAPLIIPNISLYSALASINQSNDLYAVKKISNSK